MLDLEALQAAPSCPSCGTQFLAPWCPMCHAGMPRTGPAMNTAAPRRAARRRRPLCPQCRHVVRRCVCAASLAAIDWFGDPG